MFKEYLSKKGEAVSYLEQSATLLKGLGEATVARLVTRSLDELQRGRFNLTIVGGFNRGKSTLLNALMRQKNDDLSPISFSPCTSVIIKYRDRSLSPDGLPKAVLNFAPHKKTGTQLTTEIRLSELRDYATESGNPGNVKGVESIDVYGDFPSWSHAMNIVDSPGQNSVYGHHDELLRHFLPASDAIIFLIAADLPLDGGDLELLTQLAQCDQRKVFFVLSKVDELDCPDELIETEELIHAKVRSSGLHCGKVYPICAQSVYESLSADAEKEDFERVLESSGMRDLERDLEEFILSSSTENELIQQRLAGLIAQNTEALSRHKRLREQILSHEVKPDQLREEQVQLEMLCKELDAELPVTLQGVDRELTRVREHVMAELAEKRPSMESALVAELQQEGLLQTAFSGSGRMNDRVTQAIAAQLSPMLYHLNADLEKLLAPIGRVDSKVRVMLSGSQVPSLPHMAFSPSTQSSDASPTQAVSAVYSGVRDDLAKIQNSSIGQAVLASGATAAVASKAKEEASRVVEDVIKDVKVALDEAKKAKEANEDKLGAREAASIVIKTVPYLASGLPVAGVAAAVLLVSGTVYLGLRWQKAKTIEESKAMLVKLFNEACEQILEQLNLFKDHFSNSYSSQIKDQLKEHASRIDTIVQLLANFDEQASAKLKGEVQAIQYMLDRQASVLQVLHS